MGLYRINGDKFDPLKPIRFADNAIRERDHLQRMLRDSIEVIDPALMVIAEEFSDWQDSRRRVDLLCLDEDARLVVVELKRTEDGGQMDLQAVRYAAMVSLMTFSRLVRAHERYLEQIGERDADAERRILEFLGWDDPAKHEFPLDVRIVLVSADFSTEVTTTALWLNEHNLDVRCIRLSPHQIGDDAAP